MNKQQLKDAEYGFWKYACGNDNKINNVEECRLLHPDCPFWTCKFYKYLKKWKKEPWNVRLKNWFNDEFAFWVFVVILMTLVLLSCFVHIFIWCWLKVIDLIRKKK